MLRIRLGRNVTSNYKEKGIVHNPDFIIYDTDEAEYRHFWTNTVNNPKGYLYTDGIQVIRIGWWQSWLQSLKSWFGFENGCATEKVEMTLAKIAYHGYIKGLNTPDILKSMPPIISPSYTTLISQPRNNQNSAQLQRLLISYYMTHSEQITPWYAAEQTVPSFGQTFNKEFQAHLVPSIDPQDKNVISKTISELNLYGNLSIAHLKNSLFAQTYSESLAKRGHYAQALMWDDAVKYKFLEEFIIFYITHKDTIENALNHAIALIEKLFKSSKTEDRNKSVHYIRNYLLPSDQVTHLHEDSQLRREVAQSYLQDARIEKNASSLSKLFFGNNLIRLLAHAIQLAPDILEGDESMQDIILKEEWAVYLFNEAIKDKRFLDARILFETNPSFKFDKNNLALLKTNYLDELTTKQQAVRKHLEQSNCPQAAQTAKEVVAIAQKITLITPENHPLLAAATINYAGTLIEIDKIICPDKKNADLERLNKAQKLLTRCALSSKTPLYKQRFNELLLRKIDCLIEKVRVPIDFNDRLSTRKEFLPTIKSWLDLLDQNLSAFIAKNEQKPTKEMRALLGKLHYIKGDLSHFFYRNRQEALPCFKKAAELMPENPYYRLRHFELADDQRRHNVRTEIEEIAHLNMEHYSMWMEERWNQERVMSEGFDIHDIQPEEQGVFARLGRLFSA